MKMTSIRSLAAVTLAVTLSASHGAPLVTNLQDNGPGSLRQAIAEAVPGSTISLTNNGTIALSSGALVIGKNLTLQGPGASRLAVSGSGVSRVFNIASGATVQISGLTVRDGKSADGGTGAAGDNGGGIINAGTLTLIDCMITNNAAGRGGSGATGANGKLVSSTEPNYTGNGGPGGTGGDGGSGGGIYNYPSATLTLRRCVVSGNSSGSGGAGGTGGSGDYGWINWPAHGGAGGNGGRGGCGAGVCNDGASMMEACQVSGNVGGSGGNGGKGGAAGRSRWWGATGGFGGNAGAGGSGAGVHSTASLRMQACLVSWNVGGTGGRGGDGAHGGEIYYDGVADGGDGGVGGRGGDGAGGCARGGQLSLTNCTIAGNLSGAGGDGGYGGEMGTIHQYGQAGIGIPASGGDGGNGGGLASDAGTSGLVWVVSCTIGQNKASGGGLCDPVLGPHFGKRPGLPGAGGGVYGGSGTCTVANTIIALNVHATRIADDVSGAFVSLGYNLIETTNGSTGFGVSGDLLSVAPLLTGLGDHGGPTWTYDLWPESPAINAGTNLEATLTTDQRGSNRMVCATWDIGAVEFGGCPWLWHPAAQQALYFDGYQDCVRAGGSANSVNLANSSFTVEAWVKRNSISTFDCIVGQGTWQPDHGLFFGFLPENKFIFAFWSNDLVTTNTFTDTDWHHWAATYETNGRVRAIYRDGLAIASDTSPTDYVGTGRLYIGDFPERGYPLEGAIDEVRVWNVARSAEEIAQNRNGTLTGTEPGLVAYYRFDEGSGTLTRDLKANADAEIDGPQWVRSGTPLYRPIVQTLAADQGSSTQITLHGLINPAGPSNTVAWFEYGKTAYFGSNTPSQTVGTGLTPVTKSFVVSNLASGTRYYFRVVARNGAGTSYGETVTFDTLAIGSGYPITTRANNGRSTTSPRHITDSEGNVYLAGLFSDTATFNGIIRTSGSPTNAFLAELARKGDWRWAVSIPVTNGQAQIKALALENETNVVVAGCFSGAATFGANTLSAPANSTRAFIARFRRASTNWTWATALGSGTENSANALAVGTNGAIFVAGHFSGSAVIGTNTLTSAGGSDVFVARFNSAGQPDWAKRAGGMDQDAATALALSGDGVCVTGFYTGAMGSLTNRGASDLFVAMFDAKNGNPQWWGRAGGPNSDKGTALAIDKSGNIYVAGQFDGPADFSGSSLGLESGMNLVVVQLTSQGILTSRAAAVAQGAWADSIAISPSGDIFVTGDFTGAMTYGPDKTPVGTGITENSDVFLARLEAREDSLGWVQSDFKRIGGAADETRGTVSVDPAGSVVVSGTYAQGLRVGYVELSTSNPQEIFLARVDEEGLYEHNRWEIGRNIDPPLEALASVSENRAKGLWSIEILTAPAGLSDSDGGNSFVWNDYEKKLYPIRPVTARVKWRLDEVNTNAANVATMVGKCFWPDHPQTNVAGAPVEVQGPLVGRGYSCAGVVFNTNEASLLPVLRGSEQFQIFQTPATNAGYNVLHYTKQTGLGNSVFEVVYTRPFGSWAAIETNVDVGKRLRHTHQDPTGKNGYVFYERSFYDASAHVRATRAGPIIPVNRNLHLDPSRELVVVWYRTNEVTGVAWGSDPVLYKPKWPADATNIVIASAKGAAANYEKAQIYHQPDPNLAGFNPNEEHAMMVGNRVYALRCDLNYTLNPMASEPYVLIKYLGPDNTNDWRMDVFRVLGEDTENKFASFTNATAGDELPVPTPLDTLPLCASSNRIAYGQTHAHQVHSGRIYAKSSNYVQLQYWYPSQADFYFGPTNPPLGTAIPWMSQYNQAAVSPGASRSLGEPVLVGYQVLWPTNVPVMESGETLTTSKHELPDLIGFASARVIYDDGNPTGTNWLNSLVRIFDPLSERTIQLTNAFKLPPSIVTAEDTQGRTVFSDLPWHIRIRFSYDSLNKRLSFGGWHDPDYGLGEPLLLPNILSPRERDRIQQLAEGERDTTLRAAFTNAINLLYHLTRNPNYVDANQDGKPDQEMRAGLITQIRSGREEILIGPVMPGPTNNFTTWRTNLLATSVYPPRTNIIQEQFPAIPKALTAGLRAGSGYVTIVENDDPELPGAPIRLYVLRVTNTLFRGDLKVLPSENVFDERLTLRHSADFGGEPQNYEFEWYYQPDQYGSSPPLPVLAAGQTNWNGWVRLPVLPTGTQRGVNDVTLGEGESLSRLMVLSDNWLICRYRGIAGSVPTDWSAWVGNAGGDRAMLAEGWIKRVIAGLNPFDSRASDFHKSSAGTYASMVLEAGPRYEGPIAFNPDPSYLDSVGLIEAYETVLARARKLSIDGSPAVNFGPANNALLLAAGKIADLYMLLGNEAYADAQDPTIGFTTSSGEYGNLAPCIFCFQNQLDSPLEEELVLLRGRDDSGMSVRARPIYNRLVWNFTQGEGEVAYKLTYNISDQNSDGKINESDARVLYPQGHGDGWGHYLTAIKEYYALLRHPNYEWVPRSESLTVSGEPVGVDYLDERKFAQAAAAKAKTGREIVNLTYRQQYVADPGGQWQGYKDTQTNRAWGVSEWATRAGVGAYFDWVAANAILPAVDPNTNHVGIQKIDRTTVAELNEIPAQFAAIEAQLDGVDRGLNPLGLAVGAMPFDIDPSKVAAGETHFDQVYQRALKAMENTLALFDHVNNLSQSLRRNQDEVDVFNSNVEDQERDYRNRMIEIFGYPYAGDIGPAGTYPSGYNGPDLYHYMYVNAGNLTGDKTEPNKLMTNYYKPIQFPDINAATDLFFPDDVKNLAKPALAGDGTFHVNCPMVENGAYPFAAPAAWGNRRAPGKIQNALSEMLKARARLNQGLISHYNLRKQIQDELKLLRSQLDLATASVSIKAGNLAYVEAINVFELTMKSAADTAKQAGDKVDKGTEAAVESMPRSAGTSCDVTAPARGTLRTIGAASSLTLSAVAKKLSLFGEQSDDAKLVMEAVTDLAMEIPTQKYELEQHAKAIEQLSREEAARRVELYTLQEDLEQAYSAYLAVLAEGQRVEEERYNFRVKTASQVTEYRYQDMAFRVFQNDALQKYRAQFDLAARYVYLAAKAYDYETCLLNTDAGAGSKLLTDIVRQRTLGQLVSGLPVSGRHGLADPLARLGQNFEVYRGQLGFTTPETETGRFSLRTELFRVRAGDLVTNALNGLVSTNQDWRAVLAECRVPDLWKVPEFRRFCRPFAPESAGAQPGLVIRIPTTITFGLNYFGWPLGPGDSAYDASRFATKVRSAGVWFTDYNLSGLSMTPRVYLVPAGTDILRSPSSYQLETRSFNVVDQKLPVPFPIGANDLANPNWIPVNDSLSETFGDIRRFSSFRAYHDQGWFDESEATQDTRLIGRSVWNTSWLLIIPGGTFLYDPDKGLDTFINTVGDIKIFFQTYSYPGN